MPNRTIYISKENIDKFDALHNKSEFIARMLNDPLVQTHSHSYTVPVAWITLSGYSEVRKLRCSHCPSELDRT